MLKRWARMGLLVLVAFVLASCVSTQKNKYKLVKDEATGYSYGAVKNGEFIADPAMFRNSKLKLRIRNTTGDPALNIYSFRQQLEDSYRNVGYEVTSEDDFGILLDINVKYFGQVTEMLPAEYTFLGAAMGGVAGASSGIQGGRAADAFTGMAAGTVIGAALSEVIRNYATDETFIIVSAVTMATVMPEHSEDERSISFVTGKKIREKKTNFKGFRSRETVELAVYAGGRMAGKSDVISEVRNRHLRILKDII